MFSEDEPLDSNPHKVEDMNDYVGGTVILGRPETKGLARSTASSFGGTQNVHAMNRMSMN